MKIPLKALASVLALVSVIIISSCGGGSDPEPSIEDQQLEKLSATWNVSSVSLDGVDKTADYKTPAVTSNFQLIISGTPGSSSFGYSTNGRPKTSPWLASGTWKFGSNVEQVILRGDLDPKEMTYAVSSDGKTLELNFSFSGAGYQSSRTSNVSGQWKFVFTK